MKSISTNFLSFSHKFSPTKITHYTVLTLAAAQVFLFSPRVPVMVPIIVRSKPLSLAQVSTVHHSTVSIYLHVALVQVSHDHNNHFCSLSVTVGLSVVTNEISSGENIQMPTVANKPVSLLFQCYVTIQTNLE